MADPDPTPVTYALCPELNVLLWQDTDASGGPLVPISTDAGWQALTREQLWRLACDITSMAAQHDRALGGPARQGADRLAEVLSEALRARPVAEQLQALVSATSLLAYEEARLGTAILEDLRGPSRGAALGVTLAQVADALEVDEPDAVRFRAEQDRQLQQILGYIRTTQTY
jgi:hypothetical protein